MDSYFKKWCCFIIFLDEERQDDLEILQHTLAVVAIFPLQIYIYAKKGFQLPVGSDPAIKLFTITKATKEFQRQEAFELAFKNDFRKVMLFESNTLQLEEKHLLEGFNCLKMLEFCIGPLQSGKYYLLGMNYFEPALFKNVLWQSEMLTKDLIREIGRLKHALYRLPILK